MEVISGFKRYFQKYLKDRFVAQKGYIWDSSTTNHSHKKREDSLETRAELAVLRTYVENQSILELILFYLASKYKQTKEKGSDDCFWTHIFTFYFFIIMFSLLSGFFLLFFLSTCKYNRIKLCYNKLHFVKETKISTVSNTSCSYILSSCWKSSLNLSITFYVYIFFSLHIFLSQNWWQDQFRYLTYQEKCIILSSRNISVIHNIQFALNFS